MQFMMNASQTLKARKADTKAATSEARQTQVSALDTTVEVSVLQPLP